MGTGAVWIVLGQRQYTHRTRRRRLAAIRVWQRFEKGDHDQRAGTGGVAERLGPIVLASADPVPASGPAQAQDWLIQQMPDTPTSHPDTVPMAT